MIVCNLFHNINAVFDGFNTVDGFNTSQIVHECFPHQGQGSHYVVQVPDHRVHVYNQWWTLGNRLPS